MSGAPRVSRLESLALEGAQRRVQIDLAASAAGVSRLPPAAVIGAALGLFVGGFALRLSVDDPGALIANFYTVPIAMLAIAFGLRAGIASAAFAFVLVWAWGQIENQHVGLLGYSTRGAVFLLVGALVGHYSERLRRDIAERRGAEAELEIRANDLAISNAELSRAVTRLEAFAEIARAVGGETELRTVLDRILEHGLAIVETRTLIAYLELDGKPAAAAVTDAHSGSLQAVERLAATVLRSGAPGRLAADQGDQPAAIVVPLRWHGRTLGALAAVGTPSGRPFDDEDEELISSVAASAAAAVATAKSVASDRLRHAIQASEEARARWARELHDETLQGLVGLRMLLASARRSRSVDDIRDAMSDALDQTRREILNLRGLIAELRPAALDELGLGEAIETLCERSAAAAGLDVVTRVELAEGQAPRERETETTVYRLVQEALTNAARHSGASTVGVKVAEDGGSIDVMVIDDGHGFDPDAHTAGFGIRGMRERVRLADGQLRIDSSARGSVVHARLPAPGRR